MKHLFEVISAMLLVFMCAMTVWIAIAPPQNKFINLGAEVTTTDEYNTLFNDSFSGRVVSIDELYIVRDDNGTEREFEWKWLDKVTAEEVI